MDRAQQLLAQLLQRRKVEGVHDGEPLGEDLIAHVGRHPRREVVAVGGGDGPVPEEVAVRVIEDRARRHLFQAIHQLALVRGAPIEGLA